MSAQTAWKLWGILLLKLFYIQNWGMMEIWFVLMFHDHHCKICSWFGICTTWYKPNTFDGQRLFQQNVNSIDFQLWVKFVAKQFPAPFLPLTFPVQATEYSAGIKQHDSSLYPQIIRCHIYWQQDRWTQSLPWGWISTTFIAAVPGSVLKCKCTLMYSVKQKNFIQFFTSL